MRADGPADDAASDRAADAWARAHGVELPASDAGKPFGGHLERAHQGDARRQRRDLLLDHYDWIAMRVRAASRARAALAREERSLATDEHILRLWLGVTKGKRRHARGASVPRIARLLRCSHAWVVARIARAEASIRCRGAGRATPLVYVCAWCRTPITAMASRGRPRTYCTDACRRSCANSARGMGCAKKRNRVDNPPNPRARDENDTSQCADVAETDSARTHHE